MGKKKRLPARRTVQQPAGAGLGAPPTGPERAALGPPPLLAQRGPLPPRPAPGRGSPPVGGPPTKRRPPGATRPRKAGMRPPSPSPPRGVCGAYDGPGSLASALVRGAVAAGPDPAHHRPPTAAPHRAGGRLPPPLCAASGPRRPAQGWRLPGGKGDVSRSRAPVKGCASGPRGATLDRVPPP